MAEVGASFGKPFDLQLAALRLRLANQVGTAAWDDLVKAQHDRAFVVAGAMKADLLADLAGAVEKSIAQGTTLEEFRRDFRNIVETHGWHGWTGEGSAKGEAWRTKVIYRTNMATSYAAGRWAQLMSMPYLIYRHGNAREPRLQHLAWDGLVLPRDHPFWKTHAPVNDWGCTCYLSGARSPEAARRRGGDPDKALPAGWDAIDPRTGAPIGIGKGWDYAPGASVAQELAGIVEKKATTLPAQIATDFKNSVTSIVQAGPDPAAQSPKTPDEAIARGKGVLSALVAASPEMEAAWSVGNYAHAAPALQAAVMTELRRVRSVGQARIALVPGTRKPAATVMQGVADVMPTDWVAAASAAPLKVRISTKRGYYMPSGADRPAEIATSESSTAVHEYLHHLQAKLPGLDALFQELHRVRTAGEPRVSIGHREWARVDHYYNTYQGREYGGANSALEVLTMALQPILGSDLKALRMLKEMMEHDREMLELALGVLFYWKV